jgi:hypothetical protein
MAKDDLQKVRGQYKDRKLYRVCPEWSSDGLWAPPYIGRSWVGDYIHVDAFPISDELKKRLKSWHDFFEAQIPEKQFNIDSRSEFHAQGLNVVIDISKELGDKILVEYEIDATHFLFENGRCVAVVEQEKIKL